MEEERARVQAREEEEAAKTATMLLKEEAADDQEEGQTAVASDFTMEDVTGVGSELERVHIAEKNKAMAAKLAVSIGLCHCIKLE